MRNKDWICPICRNPNPFHKSMCSHCGPTDGRSRRGIMGKGECRCQACGKLTINDLVHIVDDRGPTAMWKMRSAATKHISPLFYKQYRKMRGKWVCNSCARIDEDNTAYYPAGRLCPACNAVLRETNPGPLCEACKAKDRPHRRCEHCDSNLKPEEYRFCHACDAKRRCLSCGGPVRRYADYCMACKDKGHPGTTFDASYRSKGKYNTNKPLPPPVILAGLDSMERALNRNRNKSKGVWRHIQFLENRIAKAEKQALWYGTHNRPAEETLLRNEILKLRAKIEELRDTLDLYRNNIYSCKQAKRTIQETSTWRLSLPVKLVDPRKKRRNSEAWRTTRIEESDYPNP